VRDLDKHAIAGGVPERVVERFKAIQVDQQHRAAGVFAPLERQVAIQQPHEAPPVRQAGQVIELG
jgi:hypothetical protein